MSDRHNSDESQMDDNYGTTSSDEKDALIGEIMKHDKEPIDDGTIPVPKWCACLLLVLLLTFCGIVVVLAISTNIRSRYWVPPEVRGNIV